MRSASNARVKASSSSSCFEAWPFLIVNVMKSATASPVKISTVLAEISVFNLWSGIHQDQLSVYGCVWKNDKACFLGINIVYFLSKNTSLSNLFMKTVALAPQTQYMECSEATLFVYQMCEQARVCQSLERETMMSDSITESSRDSCFQA